MIKHIFKHKSIRIRFEEHNQFDLTDSYRILQLMITKYKFFKSVFETFIQANYMLGIKEVCTNFKRLKSYKIFSLNTIQLS